MKHSIPIFYAEYGRYINRFRAIPYYIDMLKPIERRLLLVLHKSARNKFVKSAKIVGECIGNYHPHGDMSTYSALVQLVRSQFAIGQGNWGAVGLKIDDAAAMRYTEVSINPQVDELFSELLDFSTWEILELEKEPLFLPSPIPLGLIGNDVISGISFYHTLVPQYILGDLVNRLRYLLNDGEKVIIKPNIENCDLIEAEPNAFEKILTDGYGDIIVRPHYKINKNTIEIYGRCPIYGFNSLIKVADELELALLDEFSKPNHAIIVESNRRITNDIVKQVIDAITFKLNFNVNVTDDKGNVSRLGIDEILINNYNKWKECLLKKLNNDYDILLDKKRENEIIAIIRKILEENPTVKSVAEVEKLYNTSKYYNKLFDSSEIVSVMNRRNIKSLIEYSININDIVNSINSVKNNINNIDKFSYSKFIRMFS